MKKKIVALVLLISLILSTLPVLAMGCAGSKDKIYIGDLECKIYESDFVTEKDPLKQKFHMGEEYYFTFTFLIVSKSKNDGDLMLALDVEMPFTLAENIVSYEANSGDVEIRDSIDAESTGDENSRTFHIPFNAPSKENEVWTVRFQMKVLPLIAKLRQQIRYKVSSDAANVVYDTSFNKEGNYTNQNGGSFAITTEKGALEKPVLQNYVADSAKLVWTHVENADYYVITVNGSDSYGGRVIKKVVSNAEAGSKVEFSIIDEGFSEAFGNICRVSIIAYDAEDNFYPSASSNEIVFRYEG